MSTLAEAIRRATDSLVTGLESSARLEEVRTHRGDPWKGRPMTETVQDVFKELLRDRIAPALRDLGFKGSGQKFSLPTEGFWASLAFQKSQWSDAASLEFTINLTVVGKTVWETLREERSYLPASPSGNTRFGQGVWQSRIGKLMPGGLDYWWKLELSTDPETLAAEVLASISGFALPAMHEQVSAQSEQ